MVKNMFLGYLCLFRFYESNPCINAIFTHSVGSSQSGGDTWPNQRAPCGSPNFPNVG
jgi:hypothetical protein